MQDKIKHFIGQNKYLLLGMLFLSLHLIYLAVESYQMDFRSGFVAIRAFLDGFNPLSNNVIYGLKYNDGNWPYNFSRYIYPPPSLFLYLPFGLIENYFNAKFLMGLFNVASLSCFLLYLQKMHPIKNIFVYLIFLSIPVITNVERGQIYVFIALLLILAYRYRDKFLSGALVAFSFVLRLYPGLVLLYFLFRKQYKIFFSSVLFSFLFLFLGGTFFGFGTYPKFLRSLFLINLPIKPILSQNALNMIYSEDFLQIPNTHLKYTFDHFTYLQFNYVNFLKLFKISPILIAAIGVSLLLVFLFLIKKKEEKPIYYFVFLMMTPLVSIFTYTYALVFYIPFAFYALSQEKNSFWMIFLILLPLYWPVQLSFGGVYPAYLLALIVMATWFVLKRKTV